MANRWLFAGKSPAQTRIELVRTTASVSVSGPCLPARPACQDSSWAGTSRAVARSCVANRFGARHPVATPPWKRLSSASPVVAASTIDVDRARLEILAGADTAITGDSDAFVIAARGGGAEGS